MKTNRKMSYTAISVEPLQSNMTLDAKGLYSVISSIIGLNQEIHLDEVKDTLGISEKEFDKVWNELVDNGYIKISTTNGEAKYDLLDTLEKI